MIIEKNISIILCYNKKLKISVHKQLFSMAISNLINNAIKYNVKNGSIKIKIKVIDDKLIICINDSGIGIKKKYIYRIFDKFYRIDKIKNNNSNGSGLGLSIVKQVVEAHKGSIIAKSKLNKGSKFKIILQLNNKLSNK